MRSTLPFTLSLVGLGLLAGCSQRTRLLASGGGIQPPATELSFGTTYRGYERAQRLTLLNTAASARKVTFTLQGPFFIDTFSTEIPPAADGATTLTFRPDFIGPAQGTLLVQSEGQSWTVKLSALAKDPPPCGPGTSCVPQHFDPDTGQCVTTQLADGSPCPDLCLDDPHCQSGQCVGSAKSCDDQNVCTRDSCDPAAGCAHEDTSASCPQPQDPCHVAYCDAQKGCGIAEVPDETLCGGADCSSKNVCRAGACVVEPTEDGFICAPGSPCQPAGRCMAHVCVQGPVQPLTPMWSFPLGVSKPPAVSDLVQDATSLTYFSWSSGDQGALAVVDPSGAVDVLQHTPAPPVPLAVGGTRLLAAKGGALESLGLAGTPIFTAPTGDVQQLAVQDGLALTSSAVGDSAAVSLDDGGLAWAIPGERGAPSGAVADGQGHFFVSSRGPSGDFLRALDETGQELWRAASPGVPSLSVNGALLSTDGVVRATSDGHVLFDTGAPVATSAGDPVSDGSYLWIPRADASGQVVGLDVWSLDQGAKVGSVSDAASFSGLRQLSATSSSTVVAEDGQSLVQLDTSGNVSWSCPMLGAPVYQAGPTGRAPAPLLEPDTFVRMAQVPSRTGGAPHWELQGFALPGVEPAAQGWITAGGNPARTHAPR